MYKKGKEEKREKRKTVKSYKLFNSFLLQIKKTTNQYDRKSTIWLLSLIFSQFTTIFFWLCFFFVFDVRKATKYITGYILHEASLEIVLYFLVSTFLTNVAIICVRIYINCPFIWIKLLFLSNKKQFLPFFQTDGTSHCASAPLLMLKKLKDLKRVAERNWTTTEVRRKKIVYCNCVFDFKTLELEKNSQIFCFHIIVQHSVLYFFMSRSALCLV